MHCHAYTPASNPTTPQNGASQQDGNGKTKKTRTIGSRAPIALDYIDALYKVCTGYKIPIEEVQKALDHAASFSRKEGTVDWIRAQQRKIQEAYGVAPPSTPPQNSVPFSPRIMNPFAEQPRVDPKYVQLRMEMSQRAYSYASLPLSDQNSFLPISPALAPCVFQFNSLTVLLLATREICRDGMRYSFSHAYYHPSIVGDNGKRDETVKYSDSRLLRDNLGMSVIVSLDSSNTPNYFRQSENVILRAYLCQDGCMVRYWLSDRNKPARCQNVKGMDTFWLVHNSQLYQIDRPTHSARLV